MQLPGEGAKKKKKRGLKEAVVAVTECMKMIKTRLRNRL